MSPDLTQIMLVEDDPDIQEVARLALELVGGFTLTVCSSGREALEAASRARPQMILLDVMMPEMDGPETLAALRMIEETKETPVAFMTAKVQSADVQRYLSLGAIGVIAKPFDPMTLSDDVRKLWNLANG